MLATLPLRLVHQGYSTTVARELTVGSTVVEIGCAGGIDWFAKRYRMIGLDLSRAALRSAGERYAAVAQCDATRMPLADQSVDGIVSSCLFEHLLPDQKSRLLSEAYRVLRPGGKVVFFYDIKTDNPLIAHYRKQDPDLYQQLFLDGDGHLGYEDVDANRSYFAKAGLTIVSEAFHERTPVLANSVWQKLSEWPGRPGYIARIGKALTAGPMRIPALAAISAVDGTLGRLMPTRFARCLTTVARKS